MPFESYFTDYSYTALSIKILREVKVDDSRQMMYNLENNLFNYRAIPLGSNYIECLADNKVDLTEEMKNRIHSLCREFIVENFKSLFTKMVEDSYLNGRFDKERFHFFLEGVSNACSFNQIEGKQKIKTVEVSILRAYRFNLDKDLFSRLMEQLIDNF